MGRINTANRFCLQLQAMGIRPQRVSLFGSQAKGTAHIDSDIDLVIVSSDWARYDVIERLELLGVAAARILEPVQAYRATPQEIENHEPSPFWDYIVHEQAVRVA
jgi:uncharacterized protein